MDYNQTFITKSAVKTEELGTNLARRILTENKLPQVVCLEGELGSGKTTFVRGFARGLGVSQRIISPTYIVIRYYTIPDSANIFYHIDLYRLDRQDETIANTLGEITSDPSSISCIEWADRITELLPQSLIRIQFNVHAYKTHSIKIRIL
ncbi:tRNA (adenosine(37)-N6)-threonylcarbamoyltransferase complex ATPase subunit type 1 TsaE [Candidatus Gottesmanbacteria bacterium RBG_16_43_7]|uniref:tRNA threonylcarbamoyladenosine biosynthesis protein TsaE n=1 Tax=Candidatus Gottesmanbacteria bacterium RBG_16_43_7 TaxID=1798373 RepID=A0A1F5Z7B7_9BACT|nr:MAG: tRNA (adenosine(37)-N6)-threonylcarbamoyltransferase complex ATPase subunit type 1 TsaE [Candidatus Gottesmanbacteria bacterium RBG_16_43_7]